MLVTLIVMIADAVAADSIIINDPSWSKAIAEKCGEEEAKEAFLAEGIIDLGLVGLGFGSYLGIIFHARHQPGLTLRQVRSNQRWYTLPLLRALLVIPLSAPIGCLFLLTEDQVSNSYILALLKTWIPMFSAGFIIFGVNDIVCQKIGLLKLGEPERVSEIQSTSQSHLLQQPSLATDSDTQLSRP